MKNSKLDTIRAELILLAERESNRLWRVARKAEKHEVSKELINNIREEANIMYTTMTHYPDRLLEWDFKYKYKYAFKY